MTEFLQYINDQCQNRIIAGLFKQVIQHKNMTDDFVNDVDDNNIEPEAVEGGNPNGLEGQD